MTLEIQDSKTLITSTIEALDEFQRISELQALVCIAFKELELGKEGYKHASLLMELYLENSSDRLIRLRKALETVQSTFISK